MIGRYCRLQVYLKILKFICIYLIFQESIDSRKFGKKMVEPITLKISEQYQLYFEFSFDVIPHDQ